MFRCNTWNYRFSATTGYNFPGETIKIVSTFLIRKTAIVVYRKRKQKTKLGKTRKPYSIPIPKNRSFIGRVTVFAEDFVLPNTCSSSRTRQA